MLKSKGGPVKIDQIRQVTGLAGKVAVVTGGSRGIGRATAKLLARAGVKVAVVARTAADVQEVADEICDAGGSALAVSADISEWSAVQRLVGETQRSLGPVDVVVANAGILQPVGDTWEIDPADWVHNLNVNLAGAFYTARAFLPQMVERRSGTLIFVSSGAATHPVPGWSAYCAAKAGLDHLVRNLAAELERRDLPIRAHVLYPGIVATSMQARIRQTSEEQFPLVEKFRGYHEQGWLRPPEEPAALICWLATPMAAEFHGQAVSIDDPAIRERMAADLGLDPFKGRGE